MKRAVVNVPEAIKIGLAASPFGKPIILLEAELHNLLRHRHSQRKCNEEKEIDEGRG